MYPNTGSYFSVLHRTTALLLSFMACIPSGIFSASFSQSSTPVFCIGATNSQLLMKSDLTTYKNKFYPDYIYFSTIS